MMRFLTLHQPWATLMAIGAKRIETRSWATQYRGWVGIHASSTFPQAAKSLCWQPPFAGALVTSGIESPKDLPLGCVLAAVWLDRCVDTPIRRFSPTPEELAFGDYRPGRYAWVTDSRVVLGEPIRWRGHLGLWRDDKLERWVRAALHWPAE